MTSSYRCVLCCVQVLAMDKNNIKALYRKGTALNELGDWDDAKEVLLRCINLDPKNAPAKKALQEVKDRISQHTKKVCCALPSVIMR